MWGEFRRARAFRRSEAEAVSSVQKMFEQSCIIPPPNPKHRLSGVLDLNSHKFLLEGAEEGSGNNTLESLQ